ncbi:hypothetical protein G7Z17_g3510 [Cylindrodendrum hubeiense]|uniref:DUF7726 domain-containing protein n=1 Tax=Cylindrodendrum hubeiense TaxID=595255 RepID=A0A9P5LAQ6_9HYPO|nr:hypothetical protein G7Z17_g3510 [Cylindrodendrum hubeiense]
MTSDGWSWSPTRALATFNPNIVPLAARPGLASNALPRLEDWNIPSLGGYGNRATPPSQSPTDENAAPGFGNGDKMPATPTPAPVAAKPASRKRKSDVVEINEELFPENVEEIDSEDERLAPTRADTCNQVRRKIRNWTESGAMKIGQFQDTLGVSPKAYGSFMKRTGTWDGESCDTYIKACAFFKKRELQGLPLKASKPKKPKTAESTQKAAELFDVGEVSLPREQSNKVPIFDTCDEVRKKIRALLAKDGVTQAAFVREISKTFTDDRKVSAANLRYFMGRKGVIDGNTNITYYAAYVFFEKQRVKAGKPKTKFRDEMEKAHKGGGVDTEHSSNAPMFMSGDEAAHIDKYGIIHIVRRR